MVAIAVRKYSGKDYSFKKGIKMWNIKYKLSNICLCEESHNTLLWMQHLKRLNKCRDICSCMGRLNTVKIPVFKLFFIFDAILMKIPMFFLCVCGGGNLTKDSEVCLEE